MQDGKALAGKAVYGLGCIAATVTPTTSLAVGRVLVTLGVATQAAPAPLASTASAPTPGTSRSAGGGPASSASASGASADSASGAAPADSAPAALTPQEMQWAAEAKAKFGIPCVY